MEENFELTKQKLIEETKSLIDVIVKSITPEEPIMYFFITNDIVSKEKSNNAGTIVGGLLGGVHGAIIGSVFNQTLRNFTGKIGVVVITKDIIYLKLGFNTDIISPSIIFHEQLKVFLSEISSNKTKEFLICKSQVILINDKNLYNHPNYIIGQSRIISDNINIPIVDAKVYINEKDYIILPTHNNFVKLCNDLGSLITPELFVEKILLNENPINEMLFNNIENDSEYFQQLSSKFLCL